MRTLTPRQAEVFRFIQAREQAGDLAPTLDEIRAHFGFRSTNAAREHVRLIRNKGHLECQAGRRRAIRVARGGGYNRLPDVAQIPLLGRIPAGEPYLAMEEVEEILPLPSHRFRGSKLFALRVHGQSMNGAGIFDGDLAVLDAGRPLCDGDIAAVELYDEATLKRLYRTAGGLRLVAANPGFPDQDIDSARLGDVRIAGVLVGLVRSC